MKENSDIRTNKLLSLVSGMQTFTGILELDGTVVFANNALLQAIKLKLQDVVGIKFWDCAWWNYDKKIQGIIHQDCKQAASGEQIHRELQIYTFQGLHWIKFSMQAVFDQNNNPIHLIAEGHSIEVPRQVEHLDIEKETFYQKLIDHLNVPAFVINQQHQVIIWNQACEILTGLKAKEVIGSNEHWRGFYDAERACLCDLVLDAEYQKNKGLYQTHQPHPFVTDGKKAQNWCHLPVGNQIFLDIDACPIRDNAGQIIAVIEILNDLTVQMMAQTALYASEQKYRTLFEKSADAMLILENDTFVDCNLATVEMLGYQNKGELLNIHPSQLSPEKQADGRNSFEKANEMIALAIAHEGHRFEWNHSRKNKEVFPVEVLLTPITFGEKNFLHVVWRDITERKQIEEQLKLIAHYDGLTQLPNRTLFTDRFNQAIAHSKRSNSLLAVCFLDLDNFKQVNDSYGHSVGDQLLVEVARRISQCIREGDSVSRQGGDEFALLLCELDSQAQCEQLLNRIHIELAEPYVIEGKSHKISASSGITLYPEDDADLDFLLRHADQAMYQAKLAGKNQYHFFDVKDDFEQIKKSDFLQRIRQALHNHEICLYYQPKVNMKTGHVFGVEALMRWIHPETGLIPPLEFLPQLENTDLEIEIGGWVIQQAVKQMDDWLQQNIVLEVSVNISSHQLQSSVFYEQINSALANYPAVDSQHLQLEILESSVLSNIKSISYIIKRCQDELGVNFALDDFGTGYSSLTHLKDLSANTIKIDQSFVRDMLCDPDDYSIIEAVIGLANVFHRKIIAEGVENTAQGIVLQLLGCSHAQGYGIAKPMPADDFSLWLAGYKANKQWINCAAKDYSVEEKHLLVLRLVTDCWFMTINQQLTKVEESYGCCGFEKHLGKCYLGRWVSRFKDEKVFALVPDKNFEKTYDNMHLLANELIHQYQTENFNEVKSGLETLERSFEKFRQFDLSLQQKTG